MSVVVLTWVINQERKFAHVLVVRERGFAQPLDDSMSPSKERIKLIT